MRRNLIIMSLVVLFGLMPVGCRKFYMVTDPGSGNVYYTRKIHHVRGGAIRFQDAATGYHVTLQESEVDRVSRHQWREGVDAVNQAGE